MAKAVPREPDGALVRAWREYFGLSEARLGALCPQELSPSHVHAIEVGKSSAGVATLLNVVGGFERSPNGFGFGSTDARKLARFFQGPDVEDVLERAEKLEQDLRALRKARTR